LFQHGDAVWLHVGQPLARLEGGEVVVAAATKWWPTDELPTGATAEKGKKLKVQ
jgi:hypothetical protein